jgi:hypothetical protein
MPKSSHLFAITKFRYSQKMNFLKLILDGSDNDAQCFGLLRFWNLSIIQHSKEQIISETIYISCKT